MDDDDTIRAFEQAFDRLTSTEIEHDLDAYGRMVDAMIEALCEIRRGAPEPWKAIAERALLDVTAVARERTS